MHGHVCKCPVCRFRCKYNTVKEYAWRARRTVTWWSQRIETTKLVRFPRCIVVVEVAVVVAVAVFVVVVVVVVDVVVVVVVVLFLLFLLLSLWIQQ